jgi:hypothetical protein
MTFDVVQYFETVQQTMKALRGSKRFFRVTGIGQLEELTSNLRAAVYPVLCVDDSQDGFITGSGSGYFDSRYYSIFILAQVKPGDDADRQVKMAQCRTIFRKILSKMIHDLADYPNEMTWLHPDRVKYDEVGYIGDNLFGIHFGFTVEEPEDLRYVAGDWET